MIKEDFNRIKGSSMPKIQIKQDRFEPKKEETAFPCGRHLCEKSVLYYQTCVSKCESDLFCSAADRLIGELQKARTLCELKQVLDMMNSLLTSSAAKELSLAEIVKSSNANKKPDHECDC
ncbi:hypothetical protein SDC9_119187 [bioreactor metagenome]|uniref:Uncharacterized protein n=1 Tax=bioreactor metagenome TaxID=1076179 RepID=A0A645C9C3_9ZZZZ|nr:hypothetical protein [Oscillibacter sp.]